MTATIAPTQDQILAALGSFIEAVTPVGFKAVQGQVNLVPELKDADFAVMWPIRTPRLATNLDQFVDCVFTASISGTTLTVSAMNPDFLGTIVPGNQIFGVGLADNTLVVAQVSGTPGGVGVYTISVAQTVASETMAAGVETLIQSVEVVVQVDVHGPNAWDNSAVLSTVFFDQRAADILEGTGVSPLYVEDPRQLPFVNSEQNYENRFILDMHMQVNQVITLPQQFADALDMLLVDVDVVYPPVNPIP